MGQRARHDDGAMDEHPVMSVQQARQAMKSIIMYVSENPEVFNPDELMHLVRLSSRLDSMAAKDIMQRRLNRANGCS
eukprot:jgi/Chlat1/4383/Chrsp29S00354